MVMNAYKRAELGKPARQPHSNGCVRFTKFKAERRKIGELKPSKTVLKWCVQMQNFQGNNIKLNTMPLLSPGAFVLSNSQIRGSLATLLSGFFQLNFAVSCSIVFHLDLNSQDRNVHNREGTFLAGASSVCKARFEEVLVKYK